MSWIAIRYPCPDRVDDEATTTFVILASVRDQYGHVGVLIEDLLDATIVDALPRVLLTGGAIVGFFGVAEIFRVRKIIWRV